VNFHLKICTVSEYSANHISCSHYVAFIRKKLTEKDDASWILYNDEKVVQANDVEEMKKFAYVYLFQRA